VNIIVYNDLITALSCSWLKVYDHGMFYVFHIIMLQAKTFAIYLVYSHHA